MAEVIGYAIGFLVGIIMGLLGGGGSLLLPTFIYLLKIPSTLASAYALVLVGVTALIGVIPRVKEKQVDFPTAITLGLPILLGTLFVRGYLTHQFPDFEMNAAGEYLLQDGEKIPSILFSLGDFGVTKRQLLLVVFAIVLLFSFASMIGLIGKNMKPNPNFRKEYPAKYFTILVLAGLFIGVLSASIGAGGGVMIVPLLVLVMGLPIKTVVGTSLAIMAGKSIIGFSGDVYQMYPQISWSFLGGFTVVMIAGILLGTYLVRFISSERLKLAFAWFLLALSMFIFTIEIFFPDSMG